MPSIPPNAHPAEGGVEEPPITEVGALFPGTRYRVVALIGRGGMGRVYEVEHVELGKRFVLKALLHDLERRDDLVARLRNEWRALARLDHPNIVLVTDAGTTALGTSYFVMERLDGETLAQRLKRVRCLDVPEALRIAASILDGLSAAHEIGIIHRDVKPPNVFLRADGGVKLLDFGVAKATTQTESITIKGVAVGTPRYMSPEQARGVPIDGRADLYAAGLVIYETIAGVTPFHETKDPNQILLAHITQTPPALSSLASGVSAGLDAFVARLLAKDPRGRPHTARLAAQELRALTGWSASVPMVVDVGVVAGGARGTSAAFAALPVARWKSESEAPTIPCAPQQTGTVSMTGSTARASRDATLPLASYERQHEERARAAAAGGAAGGQGSWRPVEVAVSAARAAAGDMTHFSVAATSRLAWGVGADTLVCGPPSGTLPLGPVQAGADPTLRLPAENVPPVPGEPAAETRTAVELPVNGTPPPVARRSSMDGGSARRGRWLLTWALVVVLGAAVLGASFAVSWWRSRAPASAFDAAALAVVARWRTAAGAAVRGGARGVGSHELESDGERVASAAEGWEPAVPQAPGSIALERTRDVVPPATSGAPSSPATDTDPARAASQGHGDPRSLAPPSPRAQRGALPALARAQSASPRAATNGERPPSPAPMATPIGPRLPGSGL